MLKIRFGLVAALLAISSSAYADTLAAGSYIIPMDTDYQDDGMLKAYGLVYQLLLANVPVRWCIKPGKNAGESDFTATSDDVETGGTIGAHDYRGGPFAIDSADAAAAAPIIANWQANHITAVHAATASFDCDVARLLVNAPTIAMVADGNQKVARGYMEAAGIPDSTGDIDWPDSSPDMLDITELAGPTDTDHADGALFGADAKPRYCQLMSMHWGVNDSASNPEVVAEVRQFLNYPTHFFAECQAVNAYENHAFGRFLTPNGFNIDNKPNDVDFYNQDEPFAQMDGLFEAVGGSEPSYSLPPGDMYKAQDITMVTRQGTPQGEGDVWMTGYLDGVCPPNVETCTVANFGKISYLGGHEYDTDLPISNNPKTQGTRLFLNSLLEAPCATAAGQPDLQLFKDGPTVTDVDTVTWTIFYENFGVGLAQDATIRDALPAGSTFVDASPGYMLAGNQVSWDVGTMGQGDFGEVWVTVQFSMQGIYDNTATSNYLAGINQRQSISNTVSTNYCAGETDAELCLNASAQCGTLMVSDRCGTARTVDCEAGICDANSTCTVTNACACNVGWSGDGMTCTNIDECGNGSAGCDPNATCADLPGTFTCTCNAGYFGDGFFCADTDECATGGNCDVNATCNNAPGGFSCTCNSGYAGDGATCADIDECATGVCDPLSMCTNSVGSFTCVCPAGYVGDGLTCTDVDECADATANCDALASCTNTPGAFTCACPAGYSGDGTACVDIDECADQTDDCTDPSVCGNLGGSFECICPPGFNEIGAACLDIDECIDGSNDCDPAATCSNIAGSFECTCPAGFEGTGQECSAVVSGCTPGAGECGANATCSDVAGTLTCVCDDGYEGDGIDCTVISLGCGFVECADGDICSNGACVTPCDTDADCSGADVCNAGECGEAECEGPDCDPDVSGSCVDVVCPAGESCTEGECAAMVCTSASDCGDGSVCSEDGLCTSSTGSSATAEEGCGCSSSGSAASQGWIVFMALLLGGRRRRRRA